MYGVRFEYAAGLEGDVLVRLNAVALLCVRRHSLVIDLEACDQVWVAEL